jgi:Rrf2 family transcriptional regulator, iron-sulfur cluster assembly transcription factor
MLPIKFYETLEAVLYVALYSGGRSVCSSEICDYKKVAPRYLEPVMQLLVRHHILKGITGPKGGYTLAREKRKMTLAEILELFSLSLPSYDSTSPIGNVIVAEVKNKIDHTLMELLRAITLEDLCKKIDHASTSQKPKSDFTI